METTFRTIPLNRLTVSPANVRKMAPSDIEGLANSIHAHGLIQWLSVRENEPGTDGDGYSVVAGGRRLAALKLLADRADIPTDHPVPCRVLNGEDATEISLAENELRLTMHPADQIAAFKRLFDQGMPVDQIAARFGCSIRLIKQRLALADIAPSLLELFRNGEMTLEQLQALAITDDHQLQEEAWGYNQSPADIRSILSPSSITAADRRVRFVGLDTYKAAGGEVVTDLFGAEQDCFICNGVLLTRLCDERLAAEVETIKAEGWAWVESLPSFHYTERLQYRREFPQTNTKLSTDDEEALDAAVRARDEFVAENDQDDELQEDEFDDNHRGEITHEQRIAFEALENTIAAIEAKRHTWSDEQKARCGAIVTVDGYGGLVVTRGLVRPEDQPQPTRTEQNNQNLPTGRPDAVKPPKPEISGQLALDLQEYQTIAVRAVLPNHPKVALCSVVMAFAEAVFYDKSRRSHAMGALRFIVDPVQLRARGVDKSAGAKEVAAEKERWTERLPARDADGHLNALWAWLCEQNTDLLLNLLAFCAGQVIEPHGAAPLATTMNLDVSKWWRPTKENFFSRIPAKAILEAIAETAGPEVAANMMRAKKGELAARAEQLIESTDWLPTPLRSNGSAAQSKEAAEE
jgi:ParB family chromosome partitioning protein